MKKQLIIENKKIPYRLKRSYRAKCLRISINKRGELTAVLPFFTGLNTLEKFLRKQSSWILKSIEKIKQQPPNLLQKGTYRDYQKNKEIARQLVLKKLQHFNQFYQFQYQRISIRNQKTRWGSCSSKKNLNFNWRIVLLDKQSANYLIVHELCHLKEMNHSPRFWELVAKTIPEYQTVKKQLSKI